MTTGVLNGTDLQVLLGADKVLNRTTFTLNFTVAERDKSNKDSLNWKEVLGGLRSWTIDCTFGVDLDEDFGFLDLFMLWNGDIKTPVKVTTSETGDTEYSGNALVTNLTLDASKSADVMCSFTLTGSGALTPAVIV